MPIPFKTIELDGKIYKLRLGLGAMIEYESITGKKLTELDENISISEIGTIIWIMIKQDKPELTLKETASLIDNHFDGDLDDLISLVVEAIDLAMPSGNPKKPTAAKKNS